MKPTDRAASSDIQPQYLKKHQLKTTRSPFKKNPKTYKPLQHKQRKHGASSSTIDEVHRPVAVEAVP
jgi:hypothetical protein